MRALAGAVVVSILAGCRADVTDLEKRIAVAQRQQAQVYAPSPLKVAETALHTALQLKDPKLRQAWIDRGMDAARDAGKRAERLRYQAQQRGIQIREQKGRQLAEVKLAQERAQQKIRHQIQRPVVRPVAADQQIRPEQLQARLGAGRNVMVLDVRARQLFMQGHITGALSAPLDSLRHRRLPPDVDLVVYADARSPGRGEQALYLLRGRGYTRASLLSGGLEAWLDKGLPWTQIEREGSVAGLIKATDLARRLSTDTVKPLIVDLRSEQAYRAGHVPGARHLTDVDALRIDDVGDRDLIFYAANDAYSAQAAQRVAGRLGRPVAFVDGGLRAWVEQGYRLQRGGAFPASGARGER